MLRRLPAGLGPVPLKLGKMGDGTALLVTPLCGRNVAAKLPPAPEVLEFIKSLEVSAPLALPDHPYVRAVRDRGGTQLDFALEDLATKAWPINLQHGDFAPWNLRQDRHVGTICAFDWEYGTENGFPYIDLANFILQVALDLLLATGEECDLRDTMAGAAVNTRSYRARGSGSVAASDV